MSIIIPHIIHIPVWAILLLIVFILVGIVLTFLYCLGNAFK